MKTFETIDIIQPVSMPELINKKTITSTSILLINGGLAIVFQIGDFEKVLGRSRGGIRHFNTMKGVTSVLLKYGIKKWNVDLEGWEQGQQQ